MERKNLRGQKSRTASHFLAGPYALPCIFRRQQEHVFPPCPKYRQPALETGGDFGRNGKLICDKVE